MVLLRSLPSGQLLLPDALSSGPHAHFSPLWPCREAAHGRVLKLRALNVFSTSTKVSRRSPGGFARVVVYKVGCYAFV